MAFLSPQGCLRNYRQTKPPASGRIPIYPFASLQKGLEGAPLSVVWVSLGAFESR